MSVNLAMQLTRGEASAGTEVQDLQTSVRQVLKDPQWKLSVAGEELILRRPNAKFLNPISQSWFKKISGRVHSFTADYVTTISFKVRIIQGGISSFIDASRVYWENWPPKRPIMARTNGQSVVTPRTRSSAGFIHQIHIRYTWSQRMGES